MRFPSLVLTFIVLASAAICHAQVGGRQGDAGSSGSNGQPGSIVVASGCEDFALQILQHMRTADDVKMWEPDGSIDFMCGLTPEISQATIAQMASVLRQKISNLLQSGYFSGVKVEGISARTWSDLRTQVMSLVPVYQHLESQTQRTLGCSLANLRSGGSTTQEPFNVCFTSKIDYVRADGLVDTKIIATASRINEDVSQAQYRENSFVTQVPKLCKSGIPVFSSQDSFTLQGKLVSHRMVSTCDRLESSYSAVLKSVEITYQ